MLTRKEQNTIYEKYKHNMLAYSQRRYPKYDAEIIYNNAMYSVFISIKQFKGEIHSDQFDIWVWRIFKNKIVDQMRMHRIYYQNVQLTGANTPGHIRGYIDQYESFIYGEYVPKLIKYLPSQKHIDIFKDFIEGYRYKELSKKYDTPEGTCKWYVFDSRRIIKEKIQLFEWMSKY
jgi:DNA-directed RNA polymerase specialized sigma24 family protein